MKGQFFVMATVIMIYTLMTMIQYIYDFSDINLVQLKTVTEFDYIPYIKDTLNTTVMSSFLSNKDCEKLESDIISTIIFLKNKMIERGMSLTINYDISDCPYVLFYFTIKTSNLYTETEFRSPSNPPLPPGPNPSCGPSDQKAVRPCWVYLTTTECWNDPCCYWLGSCLNKYCDQVDVVSCVACLCTCYNCP